MDVSAINAPLSGLADVFGPAARRRGYVVAGLAELARLYGYEQIDVPIVERATSFSEDVVGRSPWPEWDQRGCFYLTVPDYGHSYDEVFDKTEALLIPEGTISVTRWLGRRLADDPDMVFPLKVMYVTPCFRNELISGLGSLKHRQFTQFGLEVLGAARGSSDLEVIHLIAASLRHLGVSGGAIRVRVGDVAVFNRLVELSGLGAEEAIEVKEALDAIAECKAGKRSDRRAALIWTVSRLMSRAHVDDRWAKVWLDLAQSSKSLSVMDMIEDHGIALRIAELRDLAAVLSDLDVVVEIDLCVVRSHEYYTGVAFEIDVVTPDEVFVEVGGGGRYDKLVKHFAPATQVESVPATGFAFGVERLVHLLERIGLLTTDRRMATQIDLRPGTADKLVVPSSPGAGYLVAVRAAAADRANGHAVDIYLGAREGWSSYAAARGIPETCVLTTEE